MQEAYFDNIRSEIIPYLEKSKSKVLIAMAWFTSRELFQTLLSCRDRGVKVELVLLESVINFMSYAPDFNEFINAGGILRIAPVQKGFLHHKFCVIDDQIVITGSYNWTYYAETRNIENILVSDNATTVSQYKREFTRLTSFTNCVKETPRYSDEELGNMDVDFNAINDEIRSISFARKLPIQKIFKQDTTVKIEERPLMALSKYDIGIAVDKSNSRNGVFEVMIPAGQELPYLGNVEVFYNHKEDRNHLLCTLLYKCEGENFLIAEEAITKITQGRNDDNLKIEMRFSLDTSARLLVEIRCVETGVTMSIPKYIPNLVSYGD